MGIGAGWAEVEYRAYGIDFPSIGTRMDQLEEGIAVLRGLLHDEETTFEGRWFSARSARNEPRPVQDKLPIWVGGGGERRTLRIAARYADAWNVPFVDPETFAAKREVLHRHCADVGRDPSEVESSVNVRFDRATGADAMVDAVGAYGEAGVDLVVITLTQPFDADDVELVAKALSQLT